MHTFKVKTLFENDNDQLVMTSVYTTCQESALRYAMALYPEIERQYWEVKQIPEEVDAALVELIKRLGLKKCSTWSVSNQVWENNSYFVYTCGWDVPHIAVDNFAGTDRLYAIYGPEQAKQVTIKH